MNSDGIKIKETRYTVDHLPALAAVSDHYQYNIYIYIYIHIYTYMYICMYVRTYVCMYVCKYLLCKIINNRLWLAS